MILVSYLFRQLLVFIATLTPCVAKQQGCTELKLDFTLQGLDGVICHLDDILMVTKGDVEDHNALVEEVMKRLDTEGCEFLVNQLT